MPERFLTHARLTSEGGARTRITLTDIGDTVGAHSLVVGVRGFVRSDYRLFDEPELPLGGDWLIGISGG